LLLRFELAPVIYNSKLTKLQQIILDHVYSHSGVAENSNFSSVGYFTIVGSFASGPFLLHGTFILAFVRPLFTYIGSFTITRALSSSSGPQPRVQGWSAPALQQIAKGKERSKMRINVIKLSNYTHTINVYRLVHCAFFTALHAMQTRSSDENSVRLSVRLSVCLSHACIVTKR